MTTWAEKTWIEQGETLSKQARDHLEKYSDPYTSNFIIKDCEAVRRAGLAHLSSAIHQSETVSNGDVYNLLDLLDLFLKEAEITPGKLKWCEICQTETEHIQTYKGRVELSRCLQCGVAKEIVVG